MSKTIYIRIGTGMGLALALVGGAAEMPAKFLGANSCASSGCHGGGGAKQNQFLIWSLKDFHSQRPAATLTTARSKQIAEALEIKAPTASARCTSCHAPLHGVPENLRGEHFKASEGVSCESCHGPAEKWIRSHTRPDYSQADRVASGMRDLQNLYVRANTCVACHQNVDNDILKAGHPELIFELDGQSVAEPKHWQEGTNWSGAYTWYVGQAVALREMSWQLANEKAASEDQIQRWTALLWVMVAGKTNFPNQFFPTHETFVTVQTNWDQYAHQMAAARVGWEGLDAVEVLRRLAGTGAAFQDTSIPQKLHARRAERLVLALDRLVTALPELKTNAPVQASLNQLFQLAQSVPDFNPTNFAHSLESFSGAIRK